MIPAPKKRDISVSIKSGLAVQTKRPQGCHGLRRASFFDGIPFNRRAPGHPETTLGLDYVMLNPAPNQSWEGRSQIRHYNRIG
jgi:hypothetical protein